MKPDFGLFITGITGFLVLYAVLAHLSARMGEGLRLPAYYRIYYLAILILLLAVLYGWYQYTGEKFYDDVLQILLITGNVLAVAASYKYWWWLKDELWIKNESREEPNE